MRSLLVSALCLPLAACATAGGIEAERGGPTADFDLLHAHVQVDGDHLVFHQRVAGTAGGSVPAAVGELAGAPVASYVWPTTLDTAAVGFPSGEGTLALAVTAHPDFDDTPLYDENGDGDAGNDGRSWHSHWVVLAPDEECGPGALKVKDIPEGATPQLPPTWPELPIFLLSPDYDPALSGPELTVRVPLADVGFPEGFRYDAVTAGLRVNANVHSPLLCVVDVRDVASGDLSLPGEVSR